MSLSQSLPCPQPAAPVPDPANKQLQHKPWPCCASVSPTPPIPSTTQAHPCPAESCVPPRPPNHRSSLSLQQEELTQRGSPGIVPTFTISLGDMQVSAVRSTPGGRDPLGTRWGHPGTLHPPCSVPCSSPLPPHGASAGGPRWKGAARCHPRCRSWSTTPRRTPASPVQPSGTAEGSPAPLPPATTAAASPRRAGAALMMQVGSRDGVPHPKFMRVSPFFLSFWAPRCTQGLGQTSLGQRRGSRTPWAGDGRSPVSCLQHPKTKPGAWHGQVIRLIRSSGCLASPPQSFSPIPFLLQKTTASSSAQRTARRTRW